MFQTVFKRYESKYFINSKQYAEVLHTFERYTKPDRYSRSRICSVYYDTPDRRLIRASLEKPVYKEKLRLRTYGVPQDGSSAFIEIKKKYKGVVCKRRIPADYLQALRFLSGDRGCLPPSQIKSETDFFLSRYAPLGSGQRKRDTEHFYGDGSRTRHRRGLHRADGGFRARGLRREYPLYRHPLRRTA